MRIFSTVVGLAIGWIVAINAAFYLAVLREFAPELVQTMLRVIARSG
ncbi:MAG: hypothetical protein ACKVVP_14955 [Chloroflexota bacterium]